MGASTSWNPAIVARRTQPYNPIPTSWYPESQPVFAEPARTPYDLNFRLFRFPVRVHPLFWLGAALLGAGTLEAGVHFLLIWIVVVFVSILVHEFGHAVAFRRFGSDSHIVLWMFGGLAVPYNAVIGRWRRIVVSLAGPIAGFILCGIVYGTHKLSGWGDIENGQPVAYLYLSLILVNLFWGIFNLLPVLPLDGGQVARELCEGRWRGRGLQVALKISIVVAGAVAIYSLACWFETKNGGGPLMDNLPWWFPRGGIFTAILFAMLAVQNYQFLQQFGRGIYYEGPDDRVPWER
jgi:stage IV sporulation protein FB